MPNKVSLKDKLALFQEHWQPRIIGQYNGNEVRLAKISGEFIWHKHDDTDELFLVVEGKLDMHFRDRVEHLEAGEMIIVPLGIEHKPVAIDGECHILLIDREGTRNTGEHENERTVHRLDRI